MRQKRAHLHLESRGQGEQAGRRAGRQTSHDRGLASCSGSPITEWSSLRRRDGQARGTSVGEPEGGGTWWVFVAIWRHTREGQEMHAISQTGDGSDGSRVLVWRSLAAQRVQHTCELAVFLELDGELRRTTENEIGRPGEWVSR